MDAERFDTVVRGLASTAGSRRQALRMVGAALLGGAVSARPGWIRAKPKPGKCKSDDKCPAGSFCLNEECVACPQGYSFCPDDGNCYNLLTDNCHCGDPRLGEITAPDTGEAYPYSPQCGGQCATSGLGHCCEEGSCDPGGPSQCPRVGEDGYCNPVIKPTVIP